MNEAGRPPAAADDRTADLTDGELDRLQLSTLMYYIRETNPDNGMVRDKTEPGAPVSIAAVGMALATIPVVVERNVVIREFAVKLARRRLKFLLDCPQGPEPDASGYKGFFYHFLDIETGRRVRDCELSTIDSAFLFAGALTVATYFDRDNGPEAEVRDLASRLYHRADWDWARDGGATLTHGWYPETGFIPHRYRGYDEGLLLYILGLGSPTHPLPPESYRAYCDTYQWKTIYGRELLYSGPLFTHQFSHLWVDFHEIRDAFMRAHGSDYFENSRRATFVQQEYAIRNPHGFEGYGKDCWGFTASDGPGPARRVVKGVDREFFGYVARGAPFGPDDGTVSPWVVVASLPFAPEIVIPTIRHFGEMDLGMATPYGFKPSFNATFAVPDSPTGWWVTPYHFGIDQGPVILMIENHRTGLLWKLMRRCPPILTGLRAAGFAGGWL
ncbi:glucoamylase family protein, partial [Aquisphaera insulae]|uniref:glucoamylase family protein n=1 Tax=Aquisphaera insulae TaxID=2712864 RepID=UPI0013E9F380